MDDNEEVELRRQLAELRHRHRELDRQLDTVELDAAHDQFTLRRLKKQKLQLKDQIAGLEDRLFPDIIA